MMYYDMLVVMSHICLNASCPQVMLFKCVTWCVCVYLLTHAWPRLIYVTCSMTHSYTWHDSLIYATWFTRVRDMTHFYVWRDSLLCVTWLTHICDMTHSYIWHNHDSFLYAAWLIRICNITHFCVWYDWCQLESMVACAMTDYCVTHDTRT